MTEPEYVTVDHTVRPRMVWEDTVDRLSEAVDRLTDAIEKLRADLKVRP